MKDKGINNVVRAYYRCQTLRPEKLKELLSLTNETTGQSFFSRVGFSSSRKHWSKRLSAAAAIVLIIVSVAYMNKHSENDPESLGQSIAQEVYVNHNKGLDIEYQADQFDLLQKQMNKLDFQLLASSRLSQSGLSILGARYCTIQGQIASQIKLRNQQGKTLTLYQTRLGKKLKPLPERDDTVKGVRIQQWQEGDLFFALAETGK